MFERGCLSGSPLHLWAALADLLFSRLCFLGGPIWTSGKKKLESRWSQKKTTGRPQNAPPFRPNFRSDFPACRHGSIDFERSFFEGAARAGKDGANSLFTDSVR